MNLSCCQCKGWSWFLLLSECFSCFLCLPDEIFESRVKLFSCAGLGFALSCSFLLHWNNFSAWGIHQLLLLCIFINTHSDTDVVFLVSRHLRSRSNRRRTADTRNKPKMCEAGRLHAESKRVLLWGCKVLPCHYYTQSVRVRGSLSGAGDMTSWSVDKYTAGIKK